MNFTPFYVPWLQNRYINSACGKGISRQNQHRLLGYVETWQRFDITLLCRLSCSSWLLTYLLEIIHGINNLWQNRLIGWKKFSLWIYIIFLIFNFYFYGIQCYVLLKWVTSTEGESVRLSRPAPQSWLHFTPSSRPVNFNETTQVSQVIRVLIKLHCTRARFL